MRWFNDGKLNGPHPKLFARPSVEAVQVSLLARVFRTSDKDPPLRNDGAAVTRTWQCHFPSDVIRRSPMERRFVLLSHTIPERPAELRPIPCPHCQGQQQQAKRSSSLKKYSAIHVQGEAPNLTILPAIARLSGLGHKYGDVCDEEFLARARSIPAAGYLRHKSNVSGDCLRSLTLTVPFSHI